MSSSCPDVKEQARTWSELMGSWKIKKPPAITVQSLKCPSTLYVIGDVLPMTMKMDKLTRNAMNAEAKAANWVGSTVCLDTNQFKCTVSSHDGVEEYLGGYQQIYVKVSNIQGSNTQASLDKGLPKTPFSENGGSRNCRTTASMTDEMGACV